MISIINKPIEMSIFNIVQAYTKSLYLVTKIEVNREDQ
jgi:hypothetical protein